MQLAKMLYAIIAILIYLNFRRLDVFYTELYCHLQHLYFFLTKRYSLSLIIVPEPSTIFSFMSHIGPKSDGYEVQAQLKTREMGVLYYS